MGEHREGVWVEASKGPSVRRMFSERAIVAVFDFLRDAKVGCIVSLATPAEEDVERVSRGNVKS